MIDPTLRIPCPSCSERIAVAAHACPKCGLPAPATHAPAAVSEAAAAKQRSIEAARVSDARDRCRSLFSHRAVAKWDLAVAGTCREIGGNAIRLEHHWSDSDSDIHYVNAEALYILFDDHLSRANAVWIGYRTSAGTDIAYSNATQTNEPLMVHGAKETLYVPPSGFSDADLERATIDTIVSTLRSVRDGPLPAVGRNGYILSTTNWYTKLGVAPGSPQAYLGGTSSRSPRAMMWMLPFLPAAWTHLRPSLRMPLLGGMRYALHRFGLL